MLRSPTALAVCFALSVAGHGMRADDKKSDANAPTKLDGSWRLAGIKAAEGDEEYEKVPAEHRMIKMVVGGRFTWTVDRGGRVLAGAGGKASVTDAEYVEEIEYVVAPQQAPLVGKKVKFKWKLDTNGRWHHDGVIKTEVGNVEVHELWERIK